jgi:hypothetical protein
MANVEKLNPLAERAQEREKRIKEPLTCETNFQENTDGNISDLSRSAYPDKPEDQTRYEAKIKASLQAHLQEGQNLQTLWTYLKEKGCKTTTIIDGYLCFFGEAKQEISIDQFMKPFRIEAESNLRKTQLEAKQGILESSRSQLASLIAELQAANPQLS